MTPAVSIVVPTFGREELLCRTLDGLLTQAWSPLEIIVVDQTREHAAETRTYLAHVADRILHVRQDVPSVVAAANRGARAARGDIVLFVDDDIRIDDKDFVAAHVAAYTDPRVGGVAGRVLDADDPHAGRFDPRSQDPVWGFFHTDWAHSTPCEVVTAPGANMSFRRDVVMAIGGFDERLVGNAFRWENDFCLRVRAAGFRVVYDPAPTVHHFYASPGGNENRHLMGRATGSHRWYRDFFHNQLYVTLKHAPRRALPQLLWRLYRGHVMNRPYVREGAAFVAARHRAMVAGLASGWRSHRAWRRESP